jgi:hypothetical protein
MHVNGKRHISNRLSSYESGVDVQLAANSYGGTETKTITTNTRHHPVSPDCAGTVNEGDAKTCTVTYANAGN